MNPDLSREPSTFALDVYFAAGEHADPALKLHVEGCARCRAYLAELASQDGLGGLAVAPGAAGARDRRARGRWQSLRTSALMAAAALGALALWRASEDTRDTRGLGYVGTKGVPAVQVVIRSADTTRVWDGRSPLRPGDAVALRAECDHFVRLSVVAGEPAPGLTRVYDGVCPAGADVLPFSLVADAKPGVERIHVVWSEARLDTARLLSALQRQERSDTIWVQRVVLHKAGVSP
jgi:hypothetical protein